METDLHRKRLNYLEAEARKAVENTIDKKYLAINYTDILKLSVKLALIEKVRREAMRTVVIEEPDCGRPCTEEQYKKCNCHDCTKLMFGFWNDPLEPFTDEQRENIASLFDPEHGFLIETGCRLPRSLRPTRCMVGLCSYIPEDVIEANYHY